MVLVLLRLCDLLCPGSDSRPQGEQSEQRRGFSIIIDGVESVNEQRCITGTSRCMQGNFSSAGGRDGVKSDSFSKQRKQIIMASRHVN